MTRASHDQWAIERLARKSRVPVSEVARLYEDARARLAVGARIKGFLGIFALRNVRKLLRESSARPRPIPPGREMPDARRAPAPPAAAAGRTRS